MTRALAALSAALAVAAAGACMGQPTDAVAPPAVPVVVVPAPPPVPPLSVADGQAIDKALRSAVDFSYPGELDGAAPALASNDPNLRAYAQAAFAKAAVALAQNEHGRIANPAAVDSNWALRAPYDAAGDFADARRHNRVADWAAGVDRREPLFVGLVKARTRYQAIRARGGWSALPEGVTDLHIGARGPAVGALRARLAVEGYLDRRSASPLFDRELEGVVAAFQLRHALRATGRLDAQTLKALNVPVQARLAAIDASLERERWLPYQMPADRIIADIAAAEVTVYFDDKPALAMRSIVGEPSKPTPLFASHVSSIQFNPAWHVPTDIAKAELFPKEARAPGYFAKHGFEVVNGQLVQKAGPQSSLGRVKFEMPNPFSVYLHDTPGRALFAVDARGRSHGCVRLEKPNELAVALLSDQGWTLDKVNTVIEAGDTRWVRPGKTMAVFLVYRTAEAADDGGPVIFRPDLYGWDPKLNAALAAAH
ncbi:MAG TPA: L,D-transpeptidase family protein [Caulobacteraceae bacterium]